MSSEYLNRMKKYTNCYNDPTYDYNEKTIILFLMLATMYKNQFHKSINPGSLVPIITSPAFNLQSLESILRNGSSEQLIFDEKENKLSLENVFLVKEITTKPKYIEKEYDYGLDRAISVEIFHDNVQLEKPFWEHFILSCNENDLLIDHSFLDKFNDRRRLVDKPYNIESYEVRTFDVDGIEIERKINNDVMLTIPNADTYGTGALPSYCKRIKNETKISRDPNCFKMAKIDTRQYFYSLHGEYTMKLKGADPVKSKGSILTEDETYGLCPSSYSLDVHSYSHSYEEAVENCFNYLKTDFEGNTSKIMLMKSLEFIPRLNDGIRNRVKNAKIYCQNYLGERKK